MLRTPATPAKDASDLAAAAIAVETHPNAATDLAYIAAARVLWARAIEYATIADADARRALGVTWEAAR